MGDHVRILSDDLYHTLLDPKATHLSPRAARADATPWAAEAHARTGLGGEWWGGGAAKG